VTTLRKKIKLILENLVKGDLEREYSSRTHKNLFEAREECQPKNGKKFEISISWIRNANDRIIPIFWASGRLM
jgi:hypothetical protein